MKLLVTASFAVVAVGLALVAAHLAAIEIGREVVTLRTPLPNGALKETRLWIVDDDGASWVHSAGDSWLHRFDGEPIVEVERHGQSRRYRAIAVPGPHARVDRLLREKYGLADRWVRFLAPCNGKTVPVRLEPVPD